MRTALQLLVIFAVAVTTLPSYIASAQSALGLYISGTIASDDTKPPGVLINAENTATGVAISTVSDDQGHYRLIVPVPGTYRVRVELFGFSPSDRVLSIADRETQADFKLALAPVERTAANHHLQAPSAAAHEPPPQASRDRRDGERVSPLSADVPVDFSFVTGQVAQPVAAAESADVHRASGHSPVYGTAYYKAGNAALDASPYALHGIAAEKPEYAQNSFGGTVGGALPWFKKGTTSLSVNYSGNHNANPHNGFATVPTAALRAGDFSGVRMPYGPATGQPITLYDPETGGAFPGSRIPVERMSPAALALLRYIPLPNQDSMSQNFRYVSATHSKSDGFGLMLTRVPSAVTDSAKSAPVRSNFSVGLGYLRSEANPPNVFPLLGGNSTTHGWNANFSHTLTKGFFSNDVDVGFNSTSSRTANHFRNDIAAAVGVNDVSRDSFDWGLPSIAFTQFTGLQDVTPALRADRSFRVADTLSWSRGEHNLKWGGEFSRLAFDLRRSNDASGSFMFTGFATAKLTGGIPVPGTGSDFADFLLGLPQKTHVQYSDGAFSFNGDAWSLYFVDDWRLAKNLTLNLGVRYEYVSPLSEAQNRLVTLDAPPDFSAVALVRAGGIGPFSGPYPNTIVAPDSNNFAPRIGIAWRAAERLIMRAGYSINYDPSLYNSLATALSVQPPFAVEETGIATEGQVLTLSTGFPALQADTVRNDFAVPRNLPLSYAQVWVLEVQNELPGGIALLTSYTGTKGSHLTMLRAPNRTATGLLLPHVEPFLWQTAEGSSILHAGSLRVQKRLEHGLSLGASYMFSRSIDDVSALGDETPVAQDESNLKAERSLSAFDQRHRLVVHYGYELPFGRGKRWLGASAIASRLLGNSSLRGTIRYQSGYPLTPHVLGDFVDVNRGGYGALRPDVTGQPVQLPQPTVERFFNTSAFMLPPSGLYGNAGRNSIIGPAIFLMDAALQKSFQLGESHTLQFRAQAANLLNSHEFTQVDTNLRSLSYGQITGVGSMRVIQLMLGYSF
jgi:trimeric autotransporter adhesin